MPRRKREPTDAEIDATVRAAAAIYERRKRGRPAGYRTDAPRSQLVSVRLTEDEHGWLVARGAPAEVVRGLIEAERLRESEGE